MGLCKLLGGGTTIGKFVWRKSLVLPEVILSNPSFTGTTDYIRTLTISNESFDLSRVDNYVTFFEGFKYTDDYYFGHYGSNTSVLSLFCTKGTASYYFNISAFDAVAKTFTLGERLNSNFQNLTLSFSFNGTKVISAQPGTPLGFVIGNNADQYPNGGEKGGYWYELIGQITSTNALSLSDSAYDLTRDIAVEEIRNEVILNGINS